MLCDFMGNCRGYVWLYVGFDKVSNPTHCSHTPVNAHSHIAFKYHVTLDSYLGSAAVCTKIGENKVLYYKMCMVLYLTQNSL